MTNDTRTTSAPCLAFDHPIVILHGWLQIGDTSGKSHATWVKKNKGGRWCIQIGEKGGGYWLKNSLNGDFHGMHDTPQKALTALIKMIQMDIESRPYNKWHDIKWATCPRCDTSPIKALVMREMPDGLVYDGDNALCPSCGLEGGFNEDERDDTIFVYWDIEPKD